jgi:hypothetical protein
MIVRYREHNDAGQVVMELESMVDSVEDASDFAEKVCDYIEAISVVFEERDREEG